MPSLNNPGRGSARSPMVETAPDTGPALWPDENAMVL